MQSFNKSSIQCEFPLTSNTFKVEELQKWDLFHQISARFLMSVRLAYIYGLNSDSSRGLLVTRDDQVFSVGDNSTGNGGYSFKEPTRVEELCGKSVATFVGVENVEHNKTYFLALTAGGQVYSCGYNDRGQLGLGHFNAAPGSLLIRGGLEGKVVKQVACGGPGYCFAVTDDGQAFGWGYNEGGGWLGLGDDDVTNKSSPVKITLLPQGIARIACAAFYTAALTQEGDVYVWGHSMQMALGIGDVTHTNIPTKIATLSKIEKIVCGYGHTLALDKYGHLYVWGTNGQGQLGPIGTMDVPRKECQQIPTKLSRECIGVVQDIFSHRRCNLTICKTSRGMLYFGPKEKNLNQRSGRHDSHHDVMLLYTTVQSMLEPLVAKERKLSIGECMGNLFVSQDESTTDVTFVIQGQRIHAHKAVLKCRNEYFQAMFSKMNESGGRNINLGSEVGYHPFYHLLYYIYSEMVMIPENEHENLLELAIQADFCMEKTLKDKCLDILRQRINTDNVLDFYNLVKGKESEDFLSDIIDYIAENLEELYLNGKIGEMNLTTLEYSRLVKSFAGL